MAVSVDQPVTTEIKFEVANCLSRGITVSHEDANTTIVCQIVSAAAPDILVIADDPDALFILLCHFVFLGDIEG